MSECPCPKHPTGCYGHPHQCGCSARLTISVEAFLSATEDFMADENIDDLRAVLRGFLGTPRTAETAKDIAAAIERHYAERQRCKGASHADPA